MQTPPAINVEKVMRYWTDTSDDDFAVMQSLLTLQHYGWAYFVKQTGMPAPLSHDLVVIAERSGLSLTEEQQFCLKEITGFNINARYDDYKRQFYARCTTTYTTEWSQKINQLRTWLKELL